MKYQPRKESEGGPSSNEANEKFADMLIKQEMSKMLH
jgi:hypothetical protein